MKELRKTKGPFHSVLTACRMMLLLLLIAGAVFALTSCKTAGDIGGQDNNAVQSVEQSSGGTGDQQTDDIDENGEYTTSEDVAEYIHTYHKLPSNYVLEKDAGQYGWRSGECPADYGIMIGGMKFHNREKLLPKASYCECDVDYDGDGRGPRRLVYTKEGTVYYTEDHYESFTQLY